MPVGALPTIEDTPLSVQALPMLGDKTKPASGVASAPPKATKHRLPPPRAVAPAPAPVPVKPKRKVVDDGF
jgi:hypothetical protein